LATISKPQVQVPDSSSSAR